MLREEDPGPEEGDPLPDDATAASAAGAVQPPNDPSATTTATTAPTPSATAQTPAFPPPDPEKTQQITALVSNPVIALPPNVTAQQMAAAAGINASNLQQLATEMTNKARSASIGVQVTPENIENYFSALYPEQAKQIVQQYENDVLPTLKSDGRNEYALKKLSVANKTEHDKAKADADVANDNNNSIKERYSAAARFLYRVWKNNSNLLKAGGPESFTLAGDLWDVNIEKDFIPYVVGAEGDIPMYFAKEFYSEGSDYDPQNPYQFVALPEDLDDNEKEEALKKYPSAIPVSFDPEVDPYDKYTDRTKSFRCKNIDDVKKFQTWANTKGAGLVVDGDIGKKTLNAIKKLSDKILLDQKTLEYIKDVEIGEIMGSTSSGLSRVTICNHIYNLSQETQEFKDTVIKQLVKKKKQQTAAAPAAARPVYYASPGGGAGSQGASSLVNFGTATVPKEGPVDESRRLRGMILQEILKTLK